MLLTRAAEAEAALGTELPLTALQEVAAAAAPAAEGGAATREAAEPEEAVEAAADMVMDQIVEERERDGDLHYRVAWRGGAPPATTRAPPPAPSQSILWRTCLARSPSPSSALEVLR